MSDKQATILVPNYKTPEITKICLRLLRKHSNPDQVDVIVIDNDSHDASLEYLRSLRWIKLLERTPEPGESPVAAHSRALDLALERVVTPFVLSIHTDTFVRRSDWIDILLFPFFEDVNLAGVGSWKLESKTPAQLAGRRLEGYAKMMLHRVTNGRVSYRAERFDENLHYLRSHCAMYRVSAIRDVGTSFSDGDAVAGRVMHQKLIASGYRMKFLQSDYLGQYVDHLNHATSIFNPEFGSSMSMVREGKERVRKKMRGIDAEAILANDDLDN